MRLLRGLSIFGIVLLIILGLGLFGAWYWINSYVQSDAFRRDVEARTSATLGGIVQIESIKLNLIKGVQLKNVQLQFNGSNNVVTAQDIDCAFNYLALAQRKLELTRVTVRQPNITLSAGGPFFPINPAAPPAATSPTPPPDAPVNPGPNQPRAESADRGISFQFAVDEFYVRGGSLLLKNADGSTKLQMQGVDADFSNVSPLNGTISAESVELPEKHLKVTKIFTPISVDSNGLILLKPYDAIAFAGNIAGDYSSDTGLDLNAQGCDLQQLLAAQGNPNALTGSLDVQSKWLHVETGLIQGEGDAQLRDGHLLAAPGVNQVAQLLGLNLGNTIPVTGKTHFSVANQVTHVTGLDTKTDLGEITGDGDIGFDNSLNLHLVLTLNKTAMSQMRSEVQSSFVQKEDGSGSIAFDVTGTTSNPQTDLPEKLLMQNTKIQNVIQKDLNKLFKL